MSYVLVAFAQSVKVSHHPYHKSWQNHRGSSNQSQESPGVLDVVPPAQYAIPWPRLNKEKQSQTDKRCSGVRNTPPVLSSKSECRKEAEYCRTTKNAECPLAHLPAPCRCRLMTQELLATGKPMDPEALQDVYKQHRNLIVLKERVISLNHTRHRSN